MGIYCSGKTHRFCWWFYLWNVEMLVRLLYNWLLTVHLLAFKTPFQVMQISFIFHQKNAVGWILQTCHKKYDGDVCWAIVLYTQHYRMLNKTPCCFVCGVSQMQCCGWNGRMDWDENQIIKNNTVALYPCSCHNYSFQGSIVPDSGFCQASSSDWPIYQTVMANNANGGHFSMLSASLCVSLVFSVILCWWRDSSSKAFIQN